MLAETLKTQGESGVVDTVEEVDNVHWTWACWTLWRRPLPGLWCRTLWQWGWRQQTPGGGIVGLDGGGRKEGKEKVKVGNLGKLEVCG